MASQIASRMPKDSAIVAHWAITKSIKMLDRELFILACKQASFYVVLVVFAGGARENHQHHIKRVERLTK
jgi:hypothetical protein